MAKPNHSLETFKAHFTFFGKGERKSEWARILEAIFCSLMRMTTFFLLLIALSFYAGRYYAFIFCVSFEVFNSKSPKFYKVILEYLKPIKSVFTFRRQKCEKGLSFSTESLPLICLWSRLKKTWVSTLYFQTILSKIFGHKTRSDSFTSIWCTRCDGN